ncbi:hypothetical protein [Ornithinimicrobium cerasi]|uniref:Uncharacterized protein n=1 Tax=Ornithinimicrobium cerasi TaxID=2248773 RepID=A0A285VUN9_9MICO|nr:hypothetical protein [Ornithinimicrobium cerasi]SOC57800.1 hypothetical protein SAMN05421879_1171 [Ornithinimicrobium cerasi]
MPPAKSTVDVPVWVRAAFGHAVVQHLADKVGADVLHLKGAATDVDLRTRPEGGSDADVLVRPAHIPALTPAARKNVEVAATPTRQGCSPPALRASALTPLKANAHGLPVVALRVGGYLDPFEEGRSGLFFDRVSVEAIRQARRGGSVARLGRRGDPGARGVVRRAELRRADPC